MLNINFLIVDDHPIFRKALVRLLSVFKQKSSFSEAENGLEALRILDTNKIDVVLLDIQMPKMNGIDCLKEIKELFPEIKVIILTQFDEPSLIVHLIQLGADGFLLKECSPEELETAIGLVLSQGKYYSEMVIDILDNYKKKEKLLPRIDLTARELEVAKLLAIGYRTDQIGNELNLSIETISTYRKSILKKTNSPNTAALTKLLLNSGVFR
jgi:DNA-binding NarL/FixJ family response regulator